MLQKFISSTVSFESEEKQALFESLTRDKTPGVRSKLSVAWQEMTAVVEQLRQFGAKDNVSTGKITPCILINFRPVYTLCHM